MAKLDLGEAAFLFHSNALSGTELLVYRFSGRESLSQPFEFQIDLVCDDPDLNLEAPIKEPACLTLRGRLFDGSRYSRQVHGVVERFIQVAAGLRHSRYRATLVPTVKPMAFSRNSRIFQQQSGPDVTQKVLKDAKVPSDWVSNLLHGSYGARDYCVQYQESDLDFISRLWEEEGIFYFFEHDKDHDKLVLGDGPHAFAALPVYEETRLRDRPHLHEEGLFEFRAESALRSGAAVLRDYKFKQPGLEMEVTAQSDKFSDLAMYYFPGDYIDPALGQQLAKVRLEELQCQKYRYVGTGNVRATLPGYKFALVGHRRSDCNQEYLIVSVEHSGTQPQALAEEAGKSEEASYQNQVECIPAKVAYRPPRTTAVPRIHGVQTAVVVGPPGEEIHCDEHGRVKVQFQWDRKGKKDDNSSCWARVSQGWAGMGYGQMFIPRIGQEMLVQFIEGDPDRPVITGRVYNGENPVPHGLPGAKNISTIRSASTPGGGGYNELKFDDTAGSEEVFLHAQKDLNEIVGNNHSTTVAANQTLSVGANQTTSIGINQSLSVGANQTNTIGANQTSTIGANQTSTIGANQTSTIGANQSTSVSANHSLSIGGNQDESVQGNQTVTVVKNQTNSITLNRLTTVSGGKDEVHVTGLRHVDATTKMELAVGGSTTIDLDPTSQSFAATAKIVLTVGSSSLEMVPGKITLTNGSSTLTLDGATARLEAATILIHGDQVAITGDNQASLNGALVEANGSGAKLKLQADAELSGGEVKLNS